MAQEQFSNVYGVPQTMTGTKKDKFDQIDFSTDCDCQITACDGGVIKVCAEMHFDPPLPHPPFDPCNYGQDIEADSFIARTDFKLVDSTSTCVANVGETSALAYFSDSTGGAGPILSTVLENGSTAGPAGGAYVVLNSTQDQPYLNSATTNNGITIYGGAIDRTKNISIQTSASTTHSAVKINANGLGGQINLQAQDNLTSYSDAGNVTLTSAAEKITCTAQKDIELTSNAGNIVLSAVGGINTEITATARDAVRLLGDISPTPAVISPPTPEITYPYATAFMWVQHGEIGHSGAGYWGLPDEGQRVMTNAPLAGNTQTFPNPPPPGIKLWSCNFSPQGEQLTGNASFSHAGFTFVSAITDITGTALTGDRNWTCTSSILPDAEDLVIDAGMGVRPDPINATYKSAIGSVTNPINDVITEHLNAATIGTVAAPIATINATTIDAVDITATGRILGTRVNIGMGYLASGATGTPPLHNYGSAGDKAGDIAFETFTNGIDFYCCFQDYEDAPTPGVDRIWWRSPRFNQNF